MLLRSIADLMDMEILVDEMYDGLDEKLNTLGYTAYSVKKLKEKQRLMGHDFNIIEHAREKRMVLVTKDMENGKACEANNLPCVFVNDGKIFEKIILEELKALKTKV